MILRLIGYLFGIGAVFFLVLAAGHRLVRLGPGRGPAGLRRARRIRAAGDDPRPRRRRPADRRIRPRAAALPADPGHPGPAEGGLHLGRGQELLPAPRHRLLRHRPRADRTTSSAYGSGERLVGASTITQQVAKNFLLTTEQTSTARSRRRSSRSASSRPTPRTRSSSST